MPAPTTHPELTLDETQPNHPRRWWVAIVAAAILTALFAATSLGQASHWARYITDNNLRLAWAVGLIVLFHLVLTYTRQVGMSRDHHEQRNRLSALENSIEGLRTNQREALDLDAGIAIRVEGALDAVARALNHVLDGMSQLANEIQHERRQLADVGRALNARAERIDKRMDLLEEKLTTLAGVVAALDQISAGQRTLTERLDRIEADQKRQYEAVVAETRAGVERVEQLLIEVLARDAMARGSGHGNGPGRSKLRPVDP